MASASAAMSRSCISGISGSWSSSSSCARPKSDTTTPCKDSNTPKSADEAMGWPTLAER